MDKAALGPAAGFTFGSIQTCQKRLELLLKGDGTRRVALAQLPPGLVQACDLSRDRQGRHGRATKSGRSPKAAETHVEPLQQWFYSDRSGREITAPHLDLRGHCYLPYILFHVKPLGEVIKLDLPLSLDPMRSIKTLH